MSHNRQTQSIILLSSLPIRSGTNTETAEVWCCTLWLVVPSVGGQINGRGVQDDSLGRIRKSGGVLVVFASIPNNYEFQPQNHCCKSKKEWYCMTCCVSNSCMYPCVPMLGRGRYASVSHDRCMHVHEHAFWKRGSYSTPSLIHPNTFNQ